MTIEQVIEAVQRAKSGYEIDEIRIIEDINRVEQFIIDDIVSGREDEEAVKSSYGNYTTETERGKELFAPAPYDTVYVDYCCARLDREYEESERYVNSMICYNNTMKQLKKWWWSKHRQKVVNRFFERGL